MISFILSWILDTEETLFLLTESEKEPCTITMTAAKPKRNRSLVLKLDPENVFLMYKRRGGQILWKEPVAVIRDAEGKLTFDLTDILRQRGLSFGFCAPGTFRHYKAYTFEMRDYTYPFACGHERSWDGFALESTGGILLCFYPESFYLCGTELLSLSLSGFGWSSECINDDIKAMTCPMHMDEEALRRLLVKQEELYTLNIETELFRILAGGFWLLDFSVWGFDREWSFALDTCRLEKEGHDFSTYSLVTPLLCRLLKAQSAQDIDRAFLEAGDIGTLRHK